MTDPLRLWRVFPWDPRAADGVPFSPSFVPQASGHGRFDLPHGLSPVAYLAESPAHAVSELIHPWRGRAIDDRHLTRAGLRLAVVEARFDSGDAHLADLCDPETLARLDLAPDRVASRRRPVTQPIARRVWDSGATGLRWWSRFWGDWHTTVVFTRRVEAAASGGGTAAWSPVAERPGAERPPAPALTFGDPTPLAIDHPAVEQAADALGIARRVVRG